MAFTFDNVKDVWARIKRLEQHYRPRDTMLDDVQGALDVSRVGLKANKRAFQDDTGFGYLQAQVDAATIRVALPYRLSLPTLPSMSPSAQEALDNTEVLLASLERISDRNRYAAQRKAAAQDRASFAVLRGAIASFVYWKDFSKVDPKRSWEPCEWLYDPRHVYAESDDYGLSFVAVASYLPEAELAAYVGERGWGGVYDDTGTASQPIYSVWYREGAQVYAAILGGPPARYNTEPQALKEAHVEEMFRSIPLCYIPAGGRAVSVHGSDAHYGQTHYEAPFHHDMVEDARAINLLNEYILATGRDLTTPAILVKSAEGTTVLQLFPGQSLPVVLGTEVQRIQLSDASGLPVYLEAKQHYIDLIERKGLAFPLGRGTLPRSAALESQLREQSERVLQPYLESYRATAEWAAGQRRDQLHYLMEHDFEAITAEVKVEGKGQSYLETRAYTAKELKWDGQIQAEILPPPEEVMITRNAQVALLIRQSGLMSERRIKEVLLGMEQPELDAQEAEREIMGRQLVPVRHLNRLRRALGRIEAIAGLLRAGVSLQLKDERFLRDMLQENDMDDLQQEDISVTAVETLALFIQRLIKELEDRLLPQAQIASRQQSLTGGAPPPSAEVAPAAAPSQGSPAGDGFMGGGGPVDTLAGLIGANSGSEQPAPPPPPR